MSDTFKTRISKLLQKSRKALRIYTAMTKESDSGQWSGGGREEGEFQQLKLDEWRRVNLELVRALTKIMEEPHPKKQSMEIFLLRDRCYTEWRMAESELHTTQKELIRSSENGDFVNSALLSSELIVLQARNQATQAVHHEIQTIIGQSKLSKPPIELTPEKEVDEEELTKSEPSKAKIIPFYRHAIK